MLDGKDILKTLVELLEQQENIKVTYKFGGEYKKKDECKKGENFTGEEIKCNYG